MNDFPMVSDLRFGFLPPGVFGAEESQDRLVNLCQQAEPLQLRR